MKSIHEVAVKALSDRSLKEDFYDKAITETAHYHIQNWVEHMELIGVSGYENLPPIDDMSMDQYSKVLQGILKRND